MCILEAIDTCFEYNFSDISMQLLDIIHIGQYVRRNL